CVPASALSRPSSGKTASAITALRNIFLSPVYRPCRVFFALCRTRINRSRLLWLDCKRKLSHRELPDGKLPAPAIIASFGVAAHWRLRKRGDSAAGIDSWQRVVKQRYLVSPSLLKTPRSVPVTGGRAVAIFQLLDGSPGRSMSIHMDEDLALFGNLCPNRPCK